MPSDARSSRDTAVAPGCGRNPPPASPDEQTIGPDVGLPPIRLISKSELRKRVPLSFPTIWKMMQQNRFPRARVIGAKAFGLKVRSMTFSLHYRYVTIRVTDVNRLSPASN
jgi:predicted DNA-binding transcriptional regulator AlpA